MNYLWGAVNAISAPYQYYKELPPINPATLTGAIDVIVVRRPAADGGTELVCSPFHVRFGKWQVLRPGEKKVNVSINGKPIPFHMKIGEAGEAFFLFETEGDVPEELITSPLLEATKPGASSPKVDKMGSFGAKEDDTPEADGSQEPDFLDLNASPPEDPPLKDSRSTPSGLALSKPPDVQAHSEGGRFGADGPAPSHSESDSSALSYLTRPVALGKAVFEAAVETEKEMTGQLKDRATAAHNIAENVMAGQSDLRAPELRVMDERGDEALPDVPETDIQLPEVIDNGDVMIDMGGYHSQQRNLDLSSDDEQRTPDAEAESSTVPFPVLRAPSAPPMRPTPLAPPASEYSWEWGAFPQKSPVTTKYPRTLLQPPLGIEELTAEAEEPSTPADFHRSKSLPPELEVDEIEPPPLPTPPETDIDGERSDGALSDGDVEDHRMPERRSSVTGEAERRSWVRWWRRSNARTQSVDVRGNGVRERKVSDRPALNTVATAPSQTIPKRSSIPDPDKNPPILSAPASLPNEESPLRDVKPTASESTTEKSKKRFAKTLRLTSDQLHSLDLHPGANTITFSLSASGVAACTARIFVWEHTDLIVVSDIDGTITKSDALGHMFTMIGRDWTHLGVAKLYTDICRNGYKIMYLTSRAIGQADSTRYYLQGIKQNDYQLPEGPVIMSPDRLMASLHREVIMRKPEVFKMACLRDIQRLYGNTSSGPFYAGFGNRITDALSYRSVNIPSSRIFTIDSNGEVKMELLELAGYNSPSVASYIHMTDLVDQMFPPIQHKWESAFTDNNFWKAPMQDFPLPDLTPPSPALSARSDTSNQSTLARLRNFSLRSNGRNFTLPPPATSEGHRGRDMLGGATRQRQLSSIERLGGALAGLALSPSRSVSPEASSTRFTDSEDEEDGNEEGKVRRRRRRSRTSMPGSLPGSRASLSDDEDLEFGSAGGGGEGGDHEHEEEVAELAFDEDLFAAGEMQNVPFL
ncbi:LNS2-domain-containing protein [Artomyces pyxidatus]|uniref:LNS2-domain-containing protein n=1 Tax=Artomyces pyxidatus TaxID=48021 RepID=A0ACB8SP86_9AGAM|nr:LNS2-domain-containing protein [Artomyces pyxidatus]